MIGQASLGTSATKSIISGVRLIYEYTIKISVVCLHLYNLLGRDSFVANLKYMIIYTTIFQVIFLLAHSTLTLFPQEKLVHIVK